MCDNIEDPTGLYIRTQALSTPESYKIVNTKVYTKHLPRKAEEDANFIKRKLMGRKPKGYR